MLKDPLRGLLECLALFLGSLFLFCLLLSFQELVDSSGCVEQLGLPRVERVASAADFYMLLFLGRSSNDLILTRTDRLCLRKVGRMDIFFHDEKLSGNSFNLALHFSRLIDHHSPSVETTVWASVVSHSLFFTIGAFHQVGTIFQSSSSFKLKL